VQLPCCGLVERPLDERVSRRHRLAGPAGPVGRVVGEPEPAARIGGVERRVDDAGQHPRPTAQTAGRRRRDDLLQIRAVGERHETRGDGGRGERGGVGVGNGPAATAGVVAGPGRSGTGSRRPRPRLHGHPAGHQRLLRDPGQVVRRGRPAEGHAARDHRVTAHHDHRDPGRRHAHDVRRQRPAHGGCVVGRGQVDALRQLDPAPRAAAERDEQQ
jgi:hypothetical protein